MNKKILLIACFMLPLHGMKEEKSTHIDSTEEESASIDPTSEITTNFFSWIKEAKRVEYWDHFVTTPEKKEIAKELNVLKYILDTSIDNILFKNPPSKMKAFISTGSISKLEKMLNLGIPADGRCDDEKAFINFIQDKTPIDTEKIDQCLALLLDEGSPIVFPNKNKVLPFAFAYTINRRINAIAKANQLDLTKDKTLRFSLSHPHAFNALQDAPKSASKEDVYSEHYNRLTETITYRNELKRIFSRNPDDKGFEIPDLEKDFYEHYDRLCKAK